MSNEKDWLAMIYKLSSLPSRNRVYVWRKFKEAGAVYYQQGVAVLPNSPAMLDFMKELKYKILGFGGEAVLMKLDFFSDDDRKNAIDQFNLNVWNEYSKIEKVLIKLQEDIESIGSAGLINLSYLEERQNLLRKLIKNYEKVKLRDYFKTRHDGSIGSIVEASIQSVQGYLQELKRRTERAF